MLIRPSCGTQDTLWYKDAIVYQTHVRAYLDSNGDGIGDFRGLAAKLDYVRDLGVTVLWILPFYPSPLRDDGYDIADYISVHPDFGTLADFRQFLREAHRRGIRVITELVLNHTSDQHSWFQRARRAPAGSSERNFYIWSDTPDRFKDARIIFKDFETSNWSWDPVAHAYFWHRFYHHQPDLNYDNPEVVRAISQVMDFWLGMGVDGFRLDAVPYLFKREGTNCENLPETHRLLRDLRRRMDQKFCERMLLAEANQWPEDAAAYFGQGDECHMAFHFPVMPRMFMALRMEDRYPILDIMEQTPEIPDNCQWAVFLRNHDELTLEMVTDEERDYMYRVYAHDPRARLNLGIRRRLAPLLGNGRRRIELMNGLLLSLPGTPVIYYGDEIGMGDNIHLGDRNGVRTPMQWSSDRNAGFSTANAQNLYLPVIIDPEYHYEAINVDAQLNNPSSMLWWMRRLIALRKRFKAFGRGKLSFLNPENRKVLAFVRSYQEERVLVVANLSRFTQYVELDLSDYKGNRPVEMFGHTPFPLIGDLPYLLTLGPHSFYWFFLEPHERYDAELTTTGEEALIDVGADWTSVFSRERKGLLEQILPAYLKRRPWFCGRGRTIGSVEIVDAVPFGDERLRTAMVLAVVRFSEGEPDTYLLPLTCAIGEDARRLQQAAPQEVLTSLVTAEGTGILTDALLQEGMSNCLLEAIARRRQFKGREGTITARQTRVLRKAREFDAGMLEPSLLRTGRDDRLISYGNQLVLKLFRRVDEGENPDLQVGTFLTQKVSFSHVPPVFGALDYRAQHGVPVTLAILRGYVQNQGDAWHYTLDVLERYLERMASRPAQPRLPRRHGGIPLVQVAEEDPDIARELIGVYLETSRLIGSRTAELHIALASGTEDPDFAPEPFSPLYQRSVYQSMRNQTDRVFELLKQCLAGLPEEVRRKGAEVLRQRDQVIARFRSILDRRISALRTRIHGNYHLGKILCTGRDFVMIDFEGPRSWPLGARRIKRSPLRDVAGMLHSFHFAGYTALERYLHTGGVTEAHRPNLKLYTDFWILWVSTSFLRAYLRGVEKQSFVPHDQTELATLLSMYLLENLISNLGEALSCQPQEAALPLDEILHFLGTPKQKTLRREKNDL